MTLGSNHQTPAKTDHQHKVTTTDKNTEAGAVMSYLACDAVSWGKLLGPDGTNYRRKE